MIDRHEIMDNIFDSSVVNNLRSDVIVFKNQENNYNSIEDYITEEYLQRSLYMRDMILARDERPVPEITRVSETMSETILTVLYITVPTQAFLSHIAIPPYGKIDLSSQIMCTYNGVNSAIDITHVPTSSHNVWAVEIISAISLTNNTITIMADTFVNEYGNGNLEVKVLVI